MTEEKQESLPTGKEDLKKLTFTDPPPKRPIWESHRFFYMLLGLLNMVLGSTVGADFFTPDQVIAASLGMSGIGVGARTVTHFRKPGQQPPQQPTP